VGLIHSPPIEPGYTEFSRIVDRYLELEPFNSTNPFRDFNSSRNVSRSNGRCCWLWWWWIGEGWGGSGSGGGGGVVVVGGGGGGGVDGDDDEEEKLMMMMRRRRRGRG
jgi:hypothetical protein